jgi:TM2 domain-containing membrane protein YozV
MAEETKVSPKSRKIAVLLAIPFLLGCLGAHRFYMGKYVTATIMFVLSLVGLALFSVFLGIVPGFVFVVFTLAWALVDFVMLFLGGTKDRDGLPVKNW